MIIPAIDLKDGKCVRLVQGKADDVTVFSNNPGEIALKWHDCGASRLHVVDLDGAFEGSPKNLDGLKCIRKHFEGIIEFGGGVRTEEDIKKLRDIGIDRIVLGTMAYQSETFVKKCLDQFGKIFIAGIDAKNGMVAIKGWIETTELKAVDLAVNMQNMGISEIIFTDIMCDGMLQGPNIDSLKKILGFVNIPVISSGGISSVDDIRRLVPLKKEGLGGVIIGKALYTGDIDLKEVIRCWQKE